MSFLQGLFGPSKAEIWQQFCAETGGRYIPDSFWKTGKAQATHGKWTITLDTHTVSTGKTTITYTRMRAPYLNPSGFAFTVYRKGIFSDLGKWMGMQDVEIGHPEFDEQFIIKGNDEAKLRQLFANSQIRQLIGEQPDIRFSATHGDATLWGGTTFPDGVDELHYEVVGLITDVERLKLLYDLFSETLDELVRLGSAENQSPLVEL
jgi:hypothetical protein